MAFEDSSPIDAIDQIFVNRTRELNWIADRTKERNRTIQVVGVGGIGKTALVQQFVRKNLRDRALSVPQSGPAFDFDRLDYLLRDTRHTMRASAVVIDDASFDEKELDQVIGKIFNWKAIRTLFLTTRRRSNGDRVSTLELDRLDESSTFELFRRITHGEREIPNELVSLSGGVPLAVHLIARQLVTHDAGSIINQLQGVLYDLEGHIHVPRRELITAVAPRLVLVNERILDRLKARPEDIHQIDHRKFEELIAELLKDMDFDVELTPATRDGGRDVLAYWKTPVGRLLCLVEAKKHRRDRPVGVQLVRNLYGTLMDEQANSAMLVTTADFSPDARKFEQRHKWQISLKNYTDLVEWIENYKKPKPKGIIRPS